MVCGNGSHDQGKHVRLFLLDVTLGVFMTAEIMNWRSHTVQATLSQTNSLSNTA
jgi:hypothetical protein